ncbi:hypothetical protein HOC32_04580, partial [Candidatus Woesearchaeota archaeon]|nr:hypothetical protein [Candidatus Woesearchaeota archaeon]
PNGTINQLTLSNDSTHEFKFNTTFTIPALTGTYNVTFIANDTSNNFNTTETSNFTVQDSVDLDLNAGNLSITTGTLRQNQTIEINATIFNQGTANATNANISLYVDSILNTSQTVNISNGSSQLVQFTWLATPVNRTIEVKSDPNNAIAESNETNNNASQSVTINYVSVIQQTTESKVYPRGSNVAGEDALGEVDDNLIITAKVYDLYNTSHGISANCSFYRNETELGSNVTNSSGDCILSMDKTSLTASQYNITTNFTLINTETVKHTEQVENITPINISIYDVSTVANNFYNGNTYVVGEMSVINISITEDSNSYSPSNIGVNVEGSAGPPEFNGTTYNGSIGEYRHASFLNTTPSGGNVRWYVRINDSEGTLLATAINTDVATTAATGTVNISAINSTGNLITNSTYTIQDPGEYTLYQETISGTTTQQDIRKNKNHTVTITIPTGEVLNFSLVDLSEENNTIQPQIVQNYAGDIPSTITNLTSVVAFESFNYNFTTATAIIPKNSLSVTTIQRCADWNSTTANCTSGWATNTTDFTDNGTHITFNITAFSGFAGGAGFSSNLTIWDQTDNSSFYNAGQNKSTDEQVYFYANYTNSTDGIPIISSCNISFNVSPSGPFEMTYNSTSLLHEYNRTFNLTGTFNWNSTCLNTSFDTLTANDTVNITTSADTTIPSVDTLVPTVNSVYNVSNVIEINTTVTDDVNVSQVFVNITYPNSTLEQYELTLHSSNVYNTTFTAPTLTGTYNITFIANDTSNNINSTEISNFTVNDITLPSVFNLTPALNEVYNISNIIEISANVTDDVSVHVVLANVTYPNGTINQLTLSNASTHEFKFNTSFTAPTLTGLYNVTFIANDTSNNINSTETTNFTINDVDSPTVTFVTPESGANVSQTFLVNVTVIDASSISTVQVNLSNSSGQVSLNSLSNTSSSNWNVTLDSTTLSEGNYNLTIISNDTYNNINNTEIRSITIDNTFPTIDNVTNTSITASSTLISWTSDSNVNATINYGTTLSLSLTSTNSTYATIFNITLSGLSASTQYYYNITSCDYANNCNISGTRNFTTSAAPAGSSSSSSSGGGGGSSSGGGGGGSGCALGYSLVDGLCVANAVDTGTVEEEPESETEEKFTEESPKDVTEKVPVEEGKLPLVGGAIGETSDFTKYTLTSVGVLLLLLVLWLILFMLRKRKNRTKKLSFIKKFIKVRAVKRRERKRSRAKRARQKQQARKQAKKRKQEQEVRLQERKERKHKQLQSKKRKQQVHKQAKRKKQEQEAKLQKRKERKHKQLQAKKRKQQAHKQTIIQRRKDFRIKQHKQQARKQAKIRKLARIKQKEFKKKQKARLKRLKTKSQPPRRHHKHLLREKAKKIHREEYVLQQLEKGKKLVKKERYVKKKNPKKFSLTLSKRKKIILHAIKPLPKRISKPKPVKKRRIVNKPKRTHSETIILKSPRPKPLQPLKRGKKKLNEEMNAIGDMLDLLER